MSSADFSGMNENRELTGDEIEAVSGGSTKYDFGAFQYIDGRDRSGNYAAVMCFSDHCTQLTPTTPR